MKTIGLRGISRRRFLHWTLMGAGAAVLPAPLGRAVGAKASASGPRQRVLVLGAGLAGLAAAWELAEVGHEVTVLEARSRPGGRVKTLREPFAAGLYAEAGALAFSHAYTEASRYIDALGLERTDWAVPDLTPLYHLGGRRFAAAAGEPAPWPEPMTEEERALGPFGLVQKYLIEPLAADLGDPEAWDRPPLVELDALSLAELMRRHGASEGAAELLRATQYFARLPDETSALSVAVADVAGFFGGAPFLLAGGNDHLPTAMAGRLGGRIQYGVRVAGVQQSDAGVVVHADRHGRPQRFAGDRAICALPATIVRSLDFEPALPTSQRRAVRSMPYLDTTRTFVQVHRGFWFDEGVSGQAATDLPVGSVLRQPAADPGAADRRAILESYVTGPEARLLGTLSDDEVVARTLRHLEEVHPGIGEHVEGTVVQAWSRDPYALGCVSWPGPGDVTRYLPHLQRPHGRVHFAGEHTSILRSTMEGALRSGIRAAGEVERGG